VHVTGGCRNALGRRSSSKCVNGRGVTGLSIQKLALHRPNLHLASIGQNQSANSQDGQSEQKNGNRD
jgi:hypothetical protein